ncbi:MAG TPA: hypothetical protein VM345_08650 [Acidimicrobiales bacterium]|nr:hypothetical protein [Acidimicrobiales bacterium]
MNQPASPGEVSKVGSSALLRRGLRAASLAVLVTAGVGALLPGGSGRLVDGVAVALVIAAPLVRVGILVVGFLREHDRRFAAAAAALLAVVAAGALIA